MKKKYILLIGGAVLVVFAVLIGLYLKKENQDPILYAAVKDEGSEDGGLEFCALYPDGNIKEKSEFAKDPDEKIYQLDVYGEKIYLSDNESDNLAYKDEMLTSVMKAVKYNVKGAIFEAKIIEDKGQYFAYVSINTNWQSPCKLYRYDQSKDNVELLGRWDGKEIVYLTLP